MTDRSRYIVAFLAVVFLVAHLRALPRSLEDIDSVNFALGVESFDVSAHQPHPPGYPVFIALGKISTSALEVVVPNWDRDRRAAVGLALWGVVAGSVAALCLVQFWIAAGLPSGLALSAAALTMASPLFWITAARPLSDTSGLVAVLVVQTSLLVGWRHVREGGTDLPRAWVLAAMGVGFLPGLRSQAIWLTVPLACWAVGELAWRRRWWQVAAFVMLAAAGALLWVVPLVWFTGGVGVYLQTLGAQGTEDFAGVEMLATTPTLQMLVETLKRTFLVPWSNRVLGEVIAALSLIGLVRLAARSPGVLAAVCLAYWPYLVFHVTFHETETTRYALPVMVPMAGLAIIGLSVIGRRVATAGAFAAVFACLWVAQPLLQSYGSEASPTAAVMRDMIGARSSSGSNPVMQMHHQVWWPTRRIVHWYRPVWDLDPQVFPGDREWLHVVEHFTTGQQEPVWLLADVRRSDTALIDPRARALKVTYGRSKALQELVGGNRLESTAWWEVRTPGWMLGRGWALSPEVAGATAEDRREPHRQPAEGWIRRAPGPQRLMIGGRYLSGSRDAILVVELDGREVACWTVTGSPGSFVEWLELSEGALSGEGAYAALTVRVAAADGSADVPELGLEQFDVASVDSFMYAFAEGWQELEKNPSTGALWRWSSAKNTLVVHGGARNLQLRLVGESPARYFNGAVTMRVSVGTHEVGRFTTSADFDETVMLPASIFASMPGEITLESDRVFVPAERGASPDQRRLGVRLFRVDVRPID